VAIGAVKNEALPISELHERVAAVILAAGGSPPKPGEVKQRLPWGDSTLVRHTVETAQRAQLSEIIVVTGNRADEVRGQVAGTRARVVINPDWASGRASSVRVGVNAVSERSAAAL